MKRRVSRTYSRTNVGAGFERAIASAIGRVRLTFSPPNAATYAVRVISDPVHVDSFRVAPNTTVPLVLDARDFGRDMIEQPFDILAGAGNSFTWIETYEIE